MLCSVNESFLKLISPIINHCVTGGEEKRSVSLFTPSHLMLEKLNFPLVSIAAQRVEKSDFADKKWLAVVGEMNRN